MKPDAPRSFLSAVLWNTILMGASLPASLATAILVGRVLGPAGKGEYTLALLTGTLLVTLLNLGVPASISYFLSSRRAAEGALVKTVIVLAGVLSVAGFALTLVVDRAGWCAHIFGIPRLTLAMWLVVSGLPFQFWGTVLQFVILALGHRVMFAALPAFGQLIVSALIVALALRGSLTALTAAGAVVASQVVTASILLVYVQFRVHWLGARLMPASAWKSLVRYSVVTYAAQILGFLMQRVDVLLVSVLLDLRAVGLYSVAYGIAELLLLLPQRFGNLYLSRVAAAPDGPASAGETALSSSLVFMGTALAALALALVAPPAIRLFYGQPFVPAIVPLLLLLPGVCALAASSILSASLAGMGIITLNATAAAAGLVLNVVLNLALTPRYGISGVAVVSSLTYWTQAFLLILAFSRKTRTRPLAMLTSAPPAVLFGVLKRAVRGARL